MVHMLSNEECWRRLVESSGKIKDTPKQPGVDEIRIHSERAYRGRVCRRKEGILVDKKVVGR